MAKLRSLKLFLAVPIFIFLTACSSLNGTDVTQEFNTCDQVDEVWTRIKGDTADATAVIAQIKHIGSKWTSIENPNLKESLKDISIYNITENLKENHESQSAFMISRVVATDLFFKFVSVKLACSQLGDGFYDPIEEVEIEKVFMDLTNSRSLQTLNGSPSLILPE